MNHARIERHTNVLGERQGYKPLYVRKSNVVDGVSKNPTYLYETAWAPTPQEIELLLKGATIHVGILSAEHPPIKVTVGPTPDESVQT